MEDWEALSLFSHDFEVKDMNKTNKLAVHCYKDEHNTDDKYMGLRLY